MSVDIAYVNRSVDAAFALVMRDRRAWDKFDLTVEGFYRSFAALLLIIPINLIRDLIQIQIISVEQIRQGKAALDQTYGLGEAIFSTLVLCVDWMIFPLVMVLVLRFLGLAHRYAPLIIAHNWGTIVVYLFSLPPFLLLAADFISYTDFAALYLIMIVFVLYYRFYTAETALDAGWSVAASVALLGLVLQTYFWFLAVPLAESTWLPAAQ